MQNQTTEKAIVLHRKMYERRLRELNWLRGRTAEQVLQDARNIQFQEQRILPADKEKKEDESIGKTPQRDGCA